MRYLPLLLILFFLSAALPGVRGQEISTIDIVKVKAVYEKEAMYFYNENWKAFRKLALQEKVIAGFELLRTATDSTNHFQLILITTYSDSVSFANSEENFRPIMQRISPNGPKMLNQIARKDFLEYITGYETISLYSGRTKKSKKKK